MAASKLCLLHKLVESLNIPPQSKTQTYIPKKSNLVLMMISYQNNQAIIQNLPKQ